MNERKSIVLIGGGGHCKSVIDVIEAKGGYAIVGILDGASKKGDEILGYPVIGTDDDIPALAKAKNEFFITVGQIESSHVRKRLYESVKAFGGNLPVFVSPLARISPHAKLGEGTIVHHFAAVNADAEIGVNCIINTGAIIEHDCVIGDHCHISTRAVVNGHVHIHSDTFVGSASMLIQGLSVGRGVIIGAGSVVLHPVRDGKTVVGNPAQEKSE